MHVVAANLMCIPIFTKIGGHVGGHLGFLRQHHDSSQSPSIFLHLRYVSNHLWNNFLWTSHAHKHPLRDWSIPFLAHLSQRLKMSYCDWSLSVRLCVNFFFKQHLLLNHKPKFHITSHECSPCCPLSKLHKWFCSTDQEGRQNS